MRRALETSALVIALLLLLPAAARAQTDLAVISFSAPATAKPGGTINVTYSIKNKGPKTIYLSFSIAFYFSTDSKIEYGDTLLATVAVQGLPNGASFPTTGPGTHAVTLPSSMTGGYIGIFIDHKSVVSDTEYGNNTKSQKISLASQDMGTQDAGLDSTVEAGAGDLGQEAGSDAMDGAAPVLDTSSIPDTRATKADAGSTGGADGEGCDCATSGPVGQGGLAWPLLALLVLVMRRRRR